MSSPSDPHPSPPPSDADSQEIEQALNDAAESLQSLRTRYVQIQEAQLRQQELRVQINRTQSELKRHRTQQLRSELKALQTQLEAIELTLESQLFTWNSLKEPFWQMVRFGGSGLVVGWFLKTWLG